LQVVIPTSDHPAGHLADAVRERLAPRDVIEAELVDGIAMALWRLRRAERLEEELLASRREPAHQDGLTSAFLRRASGTAPLALLLRYRSQALNDLNRLLRLLETRRESGTAASAGTLPMVGAAAWQAHRSVGAPVGRPANDNHVDNERPGS
jgi:hypothetical protein